MPVDVEVIHFCIVIKNGNTIRVKHINNQMEQPPQRHILLFADRLPPLIGGMEMHAGAFIQHFHEHEVFPLVGVVTRDAEQRDCLLVDDDLLPLSLSDLPSRIGDEPKIVFFNSGRWIEDLAFLRQQFPGAKFIYRTGGNEILQAPLVREHIADHTSRQNYWVKQIAENIDEVITNSVFTDNRLIQIGMFPDRLFRCVGGVNSSALTRSRRKSSISDSPLVLFCAARFVPYKNHALLLKVVSNLIQAGYKLELRLAGDGPLYSASEQLAEELGIAAHVSFLGRLDNSAVCNELQVADAYIQFSCDEFTYVPGGHYIHAEGMGRSILEAISYGTYVIALRSGALDEIVTPDRGVVLAKAPPHELAAQIASVFARLPDDLPGTNEYEWDFYFQRYEARWKAMHATVIGN